METRPEFPEDCTAIRHLLLASFPDATESNLVEQLRAEGDAVIALVAAEESRVVGHVMFSRMSAPFEALGLGPVAVLPEWRRKGIAASLIRSGLEGAHQEGWKAEFVVGEPGYYQRFGFSAELAAGFQCKYAGPYLMALSLRSEFLPKITGEVDYAPAFSTL